jgi:aminoglycoside phosphotransferase (APT) family kinase protein
MQPPVTHAAETGAISTELVGDLVAEQFPQWAGLPITPIAHQGNDNRTFRLGDALSVRLPSAAPYAAGIGKEDRVLPMLSRHVTVELPVVAGTGTPSERFPLPWSVRRWLTGEVPANAGHLRRDRIAEQLGRFLAELRAAPTAGGPACGRHSFFRGCHPSVYADEVQAALGELGDTVDQGACDGVWREALRTAWPHDPVWFHGDLAEGNILVREGALGAVIDFGTCGVGDPACDLVIAWTFMDAERSVFRHAVGLDDDTWARARGWALWKSLITLVDPASPQFETQARALERLLTDVPPPAR